MKSLLILILPLSPRVSVFLYVIVLRHYYVLGTYPYQQGVPLSDFSHNNPLVFFSESVKANPNYASISLPQLVIRSNI